MRSLEERFGLLPADLFRLPNIGLPDIGIAADLFTPTWLLPSMSSPAVEMLESSRALTETPALLR